MRDIHLPGDPPGRPEVTILVRRAARARRMSLRVSALDGRVTLSLPPRARQSDAMAFVREREGWIRDVLARQPARCALVPGSTLPFEGQARRLDVAPVLRVTLEGERILVPPGEARFAPRLIAFLRQGARSRLEDACARYGAHLGVTPTAITLRDPRSRWGSCTQNGRIMFSWRLILAPPEVLDYVAAHEVAHLVHMDHSRAFWGVVADLVPDFATHRRWLRDHGAGLHAHMAPPLP